MSLLPLITNRAPDASLYAPAGSGGGGGSGDPNPSFSSITLAAGPSGFPNPGPGVISFTNAIGFNNLPDQMSANLYSPANGAVGWELTTPANDGGIAIGGDGGASFINSLYSRPIQIGIQGGGAPVVMSSLTVSSINGAVPGGGVAPGANLPGLSTIGVSSIAGGVSIASGAGAGDGLNMGNGTINFDSPATSRQANMFYNSSDSNLYIVGLSTHTVRIGSQSNTTALQIGDAGLFVPNVFGVSTLNGSQPVITAAYPVSTLTGTQTYIPQGNVAWPLSGDIPVTAGHSYRISGNLALNNAGGTGYTALSVSGGGVGFPAFLHSYPNSLASPGNNGLAGGVSGIVKPSNTGPLQIVGFNSDATVSTLCDFYWPNWVVEDLGTGLF